MLRLLGTVAALALTGPALAAQAGPRRPALVLSGGVAGQVDGDRDLGSPGLGAAAGVEWAARRALGVRVEVQGYAYSGQELPAVVGARGSAERVGALAALAVWTPWGSRAPYVLGGGALATARVTGDRGRPATGAGVVGLGVPVFTRLAAEVQYLHAGRRLGETRGALGVRLALRL